MLGVAAASDQAYETPPDLKAADFLDAAILKGPNHQVEEKVVSDGVFNTYTITSTFGTWRVQSTSLAALRVHEIGAIAQLKEVDKIAVAAGSVAASAVDIGKGAVNLVTHPVDTVTGVGDGVWRLFGRIGRGARRAAEKMEGDDKVKSEPENLSNPSDAEKTPEQSSAGKAVEATGELAKDIVGVNSAMRSWAQKLHVDPYTRNQVLHKELRDVAQYDAGGRFSTNLIPGGAILTALSASAAVNDLIWMKEPDELVTLNETRLKAMGVRPEDSRAFRLNKQYNLTRQVRLVASLDALSGVFGRPEFVARAAGAQVDADAQFYMESAMLAELFHRTQAPVSGIVANLPGACVIAEGDRFACLFPLDYFSWTEAVAGHVERITKRVQADFPKAKRELWLTGRASPRTAEELGARGWTLRERSLALISEDVPPEKTPAPNREKPPASK
ncbi:MAG TPA: hypothetical protein VLO07_04850 [Thermoanaerobaculia bacterium]|nr:hypothetical protein [Thermoanaerobaculia bacterium]